MAMRILATWMVLCLVNFCEDISCNVLRKLEQGVPAVNWWTDCKLEQPQPQYYHTDSLPTFHGHKNEIAAIFYTTVAPPIDTRVKYIQVPYVYSIHQMIEFNRRQELKKIYENYYNNNNNHITDYMTRHPEPLTRPAKPLTASLYVTHKTEMPLESSLATPNIGDIYNNQDATENVISEVTDPIPQTQKISTRKPSSIISFSTTINTVSSLPSQLLELFHNISNYHKAQNSLTNIEKEEPTSIRTLQNENVFEVFKTTERSSFAEETISVDPRIINSSLPQFTFSSASETAFATTASTKSSYQSQQTDNESVIAEDKELNARFGGFVTVKNDHIFTAYDKELPNINLNNTSELVDNIDVNRINITPAFVNNKSSLENEKEEIKKDTYLLKEIKIGDYNDKNDVESENTSNTKYTAVTNEDISDNIVTTTPTYEYIFPTASPMKSPIVDRFKTPKTESKIDTLKSANKKIDFPHPKENSVDLQEFDDNIHTFLNESTTTINLEERENTKISTIVDDVAIERENDLVRNHDEDKTTSSLEVTTRIPTNSNNNSSKNDELEMQSPDIKEILSSTKKSPNFIENIDSDNIRANITVTTINYDVEQPDVKRTYVREFKVVTELNTLESLPISTTINSNDDFGMQYKAGDDERRLVLDTDAEPVEKLITISTVFSTSTSSNDDYDVEITDSLNNLTDELPTPLSNVDQGIPFDNIEERTLATYDFRTEMGAVFVNDDNHDTEIDFSKSLIEIPKYMEVESVTPKRKVITSPKTADNFTSIPSNGLEFTKDNLEKNIIDKDKEISGTYLRRE